MKLTGVGEYHHGCLVLNFFDTGDSDVDDFRTQVLQLCDCG